MIPDPEPPRRWTPLAAGPPIVLIGVILTVYRMLFPTPLADAPPGNVRQQLGAVRSLTAQVHDGVRVEIPQQWAFAQFRHPPQVQEYLNIPGMGRIQVGPRRTVVVAARREQGSCVVILERDAISEMDLDGDIASLMRTVSLNAYQRNLYDWFATSRSSRWQLLLGTADEMLNRAQPARRTIDFTLTSEAPLPLGTLDGREVAFSANLDGRETASLFYVLAHKGQWQYALIGAVGDPPRTCAIEVTWIQEHLSFN